MPLAATLGRALVRAAPTVLSAVRRVGRSIPTSTGGGFFVGRRRRKASLTAGEMGKIVFLAQTLGKRNPAITLIVMKALGGRL